MTSRRPPHPPLQVAKRLDPTEGAKAAAVAAAAVRAELRGLCVKLNSLQFCRDEVHALAALIDARWERLHPPPPEVPLHQQLATPRLSFGGGGFGGSTPRAAAPPTRVPPPPPSTHLHNGAAVDAIDAAIDEMTLFIGAQLVCTHLQQPLAQQLYRRALPAVAGEAPEALAPMLHVRAPAAKSAYGGTSRPTFYLAELLDETLIDLFDLVPHEPLRLAVILSLLTALTTAIEHVLLDGEPRRDFCAEDGPRLASDVALLREYFIARDAHGVPHGLPEALVLEATRYLDDLVRLASLPTETLIERLMSVARPTASGVRTTPVPEYEPESPCHKGTLARLLLTRVRLEPAAARYVEMHKVALRELLERERGLAHATPPRHGRGAAALRAAREAALAEAEAGGSAAAEGEGQGEGQMGG